MSNLSLFHKQEYLAKCSSTNSYLKQNYISVDRKENVIIRADYQYKGMGQGGDFWESNDGENLLTSFIFYPEKLSATNQFYLSKWIATSLLLLLSEYLDLSQLHIKWPNDIYYNDKKIAGVLIENSIIGDNILYSIIGIGLNVNQINFSNNIPNPISIRRILNKEISIIAIFKKLIHILNNVKAFSSKIFLNNLDEMYFNNLYWIGKKHLFRINNKVVEGEILGVDKYGFLEILIGHRIQNFDIKEVVYLS